MYRPEVFGSAEKSVSASWQTKGQAERVPDIEARRKDFDVTGWDMRAGDAVVFPAWVLPLPPVIPITADRKNQGTGFMARQL